MNAAALLFQREEMPLVQKLVDETLRMQVPLEVDWGSLLFDCESDHYDEYWSKLFFAPLERALLDVCRDEPGRAALATVLRRIVVQNTRNIVSSRTWCTFENGVLTLDHAMAAIDDVDERAQRLVRLLERVSMQ